jgi:SPP1 gp7 family putative phage head morphogenesis protein
MTRRERNQYKATWHHFQQAMENRFTALVHRELKKQLKQYDRTRDIYQITSVEMYEALVLLYKTVAPAWVIKTGLHKITSKKERRPIGFNQRIIELMREYYNSGILSHAEEITAASRAAIARILARQAESGASTEEILAELQEAYPFSLMRARRIVRTEVVTASNGAAKVAADETGVQMKKEWISIIDKRTRHDHRLIDGAIVPLAQPFLVGGEQMQQPGVRQQDNGLPVSAKNTVNCRCVMAATAVRDAAGRPIDR